MMFQDFLGLITSLDVGSRYTLLTGRVLPKNQSDINDLIDYVSNQSGYDLVLNTDNLAVDVECEFTLTPHLPPDGLGYASYFHYFENKREWWKSTDLDTIVQHRWLSYTQSDSVIDAEKIQKIASFLLILSDHKNFYSTPNSVVVFFSKKPCELSLKAHKTDVLIELLNNLSQEKVQAFDALAQWFGGNQENEHSQAKRNAFSVALTDFLTEKEGRQQHDICDLIEDIVNIKNQAFAQYELYLEDFSYSKFVKKIEESSTKFIARINEALNRSVTQILALPVATVAFKALDAELNWVAVISLFVYCTICAVVLYNQSAVITHIEKEVKLFEAKLPRQLNDNLWKLNNETISKQIVNQRRLSKLLWATIIFCVLYLVINILIATGCIIVSTPQTSH